MHPLLKERLEKPKTVFSPGHRIRMNVVPMFLNIFVPWGIFIIVLGITSFHLMYSRPMLGYGVVAAFVLFWLITVCVAINRRKHDPEPTWFIFFSIMVGVAIFSAILLGDYIYNNYSFAYFQVHDLKVISNLDANRERGQNVMDAGMFYFAEGNKIDAMRAWHFKQKTVYCVAPITKGWNTVPETQSFDFWAVGKDCCSLSASDFRCGAYNNPLARGGIRIMNDHDQAFYRLAVEQAAALYGIHAAHPVFFEWSLDPKSDMSDLNQHGFHRYLAYVAFAFVVAIFCMSMATCKFSFLGRSESVYGEQIYSDPEWNSTGGPAQKEKDFSAHVSYDHS